MTTRVLSAICLVLVLALSTGCALGMLRQDLTKTAALRPGMSKADAMQIMGPPAKAEFDSTVEEWHYCKTGRGVDQFVALFFKDDTLLSIRNYSVSSEEMGPYGSCEHGVKHGDYRVPDQIIELRSK